MIKALLIIIGFIIGWIAADNKLFTDTFDKGEIKDEKPRK